MKKVLGTLALALAVAASALASTGSRVCCEEVCDDEACCSVQDEATCPIAAEQAPPPSCS